MGLLFNKNLLKLRRMRIDKSAPEFLIKASYDELLTQLVDLKISLNNILEVSANYNYFVKQIVSDYNIFIHHNLAKQLLSLIKGPKLVSDNEILPFRANSFDLIISNFDLHFINDLAAHLSNIKDILRPGGYFLANFFGDQTLTELRQACFKAELSLTGNGHDRVAPAINSQSLSHLIQQLGFKSIIVSKNNYQVYYNSLLQLLHDLRAMAQTNITTFSSIRPLNKKLLSTIEELYYKNDQQELKATFEIINISISK